MFKRRKIYYYDTEKCTYQPERLTLDVVLRRSSMYVLVAVMAGVGAWVGFRGYVMQWKSVAASAETESLMANLNEVNAKIDGVEAQLTAMFEKQNATYLPVLGQKSIPLSLWQSGVGGSAIFDKSLNNATRKTEARLTNVRNRLALLNKSLDELSQRAVTLDKDLANMPSILPVNGSLISGFGMRNHPVSGHAKFHEGLDFACPVGTPIYASGNGVIELAESGEHGYGICMNINHKNGYRTKYAHLSKMVAQNGQKVKRGQLIAYSGNTGLSTGPHLHYEVSFKSEKTDPIDYIYMDLPPQEYARLKLSKGTATKEKVKEKLVAPAMD